MFLFSLKIVYMPQKGVVNGCCNNYKSDNNKTLNEGNGKLIWLRYDTRKRASMEKPSIN